LICNKTLFRNIFKYLYILFRHCDWDEESVLVDKGAERNITYNFKLRDIDKQINKLRSSENYINYWKLKCDNFKNKSLTENICKWCLIIKPERTYHCRECRSCFRRMDHHCGFMNNCIGINNHKLFINMLVYGISSIAIICMVMIRGLNLYINQYSVK
jgi:hypothetical protein